VADCSSTFLSYIDNSMNTNFHQATRAGMDKNKNILA
jgi:hypothetical protein